MEKEIKRLIKLKKKAKTYIEFEKEVMNHLKWYIGQGPERLNINTKQDLLKMYQLLGE
jgi:adenylosuccinate synthase